MHRMPEKAGCRPFFLMNKLDEIIAHKRTEVQRLLPRADKLRMAAATVGMPAPKPAGIAIVVVAVPLPLTAAVTGLRPAMLNVTVPSLTVPPLGLVTVAWSVTVCVALLKVAPTLAAAVCDVAAATASVPLLEPLAKLPWLSV